MATPPSPHIAWKNITASPPVIPVADLQSLPANVKAFIIRLSRNGAANASAPTTLTAGGIAMTRIAGDSAGVSRERVAMAIFELNQNEIATMALNTGATGYDIAVTGGSGTIFTTLFAVYKDCNQMTTSRTNSGWVNSTANALPLERVADSYTIGASYNALLASLTLANPAGAISFNDSGSGSRVNIGYAVDTARAADFTHTAGARASSFVINLEPVSAQAITSVNGGNSLPPGVPATWVTSAFSPDPNAATLDGIPCSSVTSAGFTPPALVDNQLVARPGNRSLVASNSSQQSASTVAPADVPHNHSYTTLVGTLDVGNYSCLQGLSPAATQNDFIIFPTVIDEVPTGNSVEQNGLFSTNREGSQIFWHIQDSTKIARSYMVTTGEGGGFEVRRFMGNRSLTSRFLKSKFIEAKFF